MTTGQLIAANSSPNLTFTPAANANGASYASFTFQVQDDGGTANGGIDLDPTANTITFNVTSVNDVPVVTLSAANDQAVDEGSSHTYSFSVSDDDAGDTFTVVSVSCGLNGSQVGTTATTASGGSFVCSFPDGLASSTVSVQVKDSTNALSTTATQVVTISNVAPTVTLSGTAAANEGSQHIFDFLTSDPGQDTFSLVSVSCGANGSQVGTTTFNTTNGAGSFVCLFPDGPASTIVSAQVKDSDNANSNIPTQTVTVANLKPTVVLGGVNSADEGQTKTYTYTATDPGADTLTIVESCGANGTRTDTAAVNSFDCTFPDGLATSMVSVSANDEDTGPASSDSITVTVSNVAPTVTLSALNDLSVNESGVTQHTYSYTISDPGADTVTSVTTSCGANGVKVALSDSNSDTAGSFKCTFPDGDALSTVSASATDSDGAPSNTATQVVTISNVAPTVTLSGTATVNEGSTHTYTFAVTDPGTDTFTVNTGEPTCGLNGTYVLASLSPAAGGGSFDCTFPDGPAFTTLTIKVTDSDGASDTDSEAIKVVEILNVNPTVTPPADQAADEGASTSFSLGSFSDPGPDSPWAVSIDWGDGSTDTTFNQNVTGSLGSASHTYADGDDDFTVTVTVTDKNSGSDSATFSVHVSNVAPTVTLSALNDLSVNESGVTQHTYSYTISDPGADTVTSVTTSCGATASRSPCPTATATRPAASSAPFLTATPCPRSAPARPTPTAPSNTATQVVTISNVAPTVTLSGTATVNEGSTHTYTFAVTDPGTDTFTVNTGEPTCGLNGTYVLASLSPAAGGDFDCTFPDVPRSRP